MSEIKETNESIWAKCAKCGKPIDGVAPAFNPKNWSQYHGACLTVEEMIALASKPKRKKK